MLYSREIGPDEIIKSLLRDVMNDFITCSKLNVIHKFYMRMKEHENDVYTEKEEHIFTHTIRYELKKMLYKIDKLIYTNFQCD